MRISRGKPHSLRDLNADQKHRDLGRNLGLEVNSSQLLSVKSQSQENLTLMALCPKNKLNCFIPLWTLGHFIYYLTPSSQVSDLWRISLLNASFFNWYSTMSFQARVVSYRQYNGRTKSRNLHIDCVGLLIVLLCRCLLFYLWTNSQWS